MGKHVVVVGGGIIGLCCAYYLTEEGYHVTVVDQFDITEGASFVNAGYITPSHFMSLASPEMVFKGVKWMFNPQSPFYIKPRLDIDFFKWAWAFKKSATLSQVEKSIRPILDINLLSLDLFLEMKASSHFDFHLERKGLLMCYKTDKVGEEEWKIGQRAQKEGLMVENLSAEQLKILEPEVSLNVKGGVYYHSDAHMTPTDFMHKLFNFLKVKGTVFFKNEEVIDIEVIGNRISKLITTNKSIDCDEVVIATGSWSGVLGKKLGLNIPVQAGKGYAINVHRKTNITIPTILCESKVAVTPMRGFTRFSGTMEMSGINTKISTVRVNAIAKAAQSYYGQLQLTDEERAMAKCGLRPCTPDGLPCIGKTSKYNNLTIATGHAMMGWSLGPATGKLVSEIISSKPTSIKVTAYHPDRFYNKKIKFKTLHSWNQK